MGFRVEAWLKAFVWTERLYVRFGWDGVRGIENPGFFRLYEWVRGRYFDAYYDAVR